MSKFFEHFITNGQPEARCAHLGVQGYGVPLKRRLAGRLELNQTSGVLVQRVEPYSAAEEAGILEGDILIRLDDQPTPSADELFRQAGKLPVDLPVSIILVRGERCVERLLLARGPQRRTKKVQ